MMEIIRLAIFVFALSGFLQLNEAVSAKDFDHASIRNAIRQGYSLWYAGVGVFIPAALIVLSGFFYAGLRMFLWLPGLILWIINDQGYSFGMWLAPGF